MPADKQYHKLTKIKQFSLFVGCSLLVLFSFSISKAQSDQNVTTGQATAPVIFSGTNCIYTWSNSNPAIGLPATGTGNIDSFTAANPGNSPIKGTITATPLNGGYAYIANLGGNTVSVINTADNQVVSTINVGSGPEGVAITPDGSKVYVGNSATNTVSVINTATNTVMATITVGIAPQGIVVSPDGKRVYVVNSGFSENSVSVINTATNTVIKTIAVGQNPRGIAISPDGSRVYATNNTSSDVSIINTANNTVITTISVGAFPAGAVVSPDNKFVYTANQGTNNVTVINTATNSVINTISVGSDPFSITESQDGKYIYTTNINSDNVSVINTSTNSVINITVDSGPEGAALSADGSLLYVTCGLGDVIDIINTSTGKIISKLPLQQLPNSFGNFIKAGDNCGTTPVTFNIMVNPPASVTASTAKGAIFACVGSPSVSPAIQQFTVSGTGLIADLTATAPAGFEVSLSAGAGYSNHVAIKQSAGTVSNVTVYVRSSASASPGNIAGNVVLTASGVTSTNVAVIGVINALPTVNTVADQSYTNGDATQVTNFTGSANAYTWTNDLPGIGLAASGTGNIASFTATNNGATSVTANITVTPVFAGYAYIASANSNNISVINTVTNLTEATIPVGQYPNYECLNPNGSRLYVSEKSQNALITINTTTKAVIGSISFGSFLTGIGVSPDGSRIYAASSGTGSLYVINAASNSIINTIAIGAAPEGVTVSPDGSRVYVANNGSNTVAVVNTANNTVSYTPTIPSAFNLAISPDGSMLYVTSSSASSKNIYFVNTATKAITGTIGVGAGSQGIAINGNGSRLYVSNFYDNTVSVVNTATKSTIAVIPVHQGPSGISVSPDGSKVYVTSLFSNDVTAINTSTNSVVTSVPVGYSPYSFGNFISSGSGCSGAPIKFTITVKPDPYAVTPVITAGSVTGTIISCQGSASVSPNIQQFTVSGSGLTSNIIATAPTGFEISASAGSGYSNSITIPQTNGTAANTIVYVRSIANAPAGNILGNVVLNTAGVSSQNVAVKGVINALPTVNTVSNQTVASGAATTAIDFTGSGNTFTWVNDNPGIGLAASGKGAIGSFVAINNGTTLVIATITVTPSSTGTGCSGTATKFIITVNPKAILPQLTVGGLTGNNSACAGSASISPDIQQFTVSGSKLTGNITVTAPMGFQVSLSAVNGYGNSATIVATAGMAGNAIVYVRLSASASPGNISGNVVVTTTGVPSQNVAVTGVINALPTVNSVTSQTVANGSATTAVNFSGTAHTFNWVNDTPGIGLPASGSGDIASFIAENTSSAAVKANIMVTPVTSGIDCPGVSTSFTITVNPTTISPAISATITTGTISACAGSPSTSPNIQQFTVLGSNLTAVITARAPANFELSLAANSGYGKSITIPQTSGTINNTIVYVRSAANAPAGNISGNVVLTSTGAPDQNVPVTGIVNALPTVNVIANQTVVNGASAAAINFTGTGTPFTWVNDTPEIGLSANGTGNIAPFPVINNSNTVVTATVTVTPSTAGAACSGTPITFTITVKPTPISSISTTGSLASLSTVYGTPSSPESFRVSGINLTSGITVTSPAGFEVSADNTTFSKRVTVGSGGNITSTPVYIRLAATTPVGSSYSGNIVLSSTDATDVDVVIPSSAVTPALLTVTPDNKSRRYGEDNPVLTATYAGFVNDETVAEITTLPIIITSATITSPIGQYSITASGAAADNYTFFYNKGILTVTGKPVIPNAFTPNLDGKNDTWEIKYLDAYQNCSVNVYSRYGENVYSSNGYPTPWNGTRGNKALPAGTYYYIIDLRNGQGVLAGYVAIIR